MSANDSACSNEFTSDYFFKYKDKEQNNRASKFYYSKNLKAVASTIGSSSGRLLVVYRNSPRNLHA